MGKGYAEGPAAEEAERRRDELRADAVDHDAPMRLAVVGCTPDLPELHVIGWADEIDADALFETGAAWAVRLERRPLGTRP